MLEGLEKAIVIVCIAIGGAVFWAVPKLWEWLKPLIHALTS